MRKIDKIVLKEPSLEYADDIWLFRKEILESDDDDKFAGCGCLQKCSSAKEWIEAVIKTRDDNLKKEGKVPSNVYIAVREKDNRIVGIIDLRHHINHPILSTWGGHIGYYVRPTERRKGYATEMLRQNLKNARKRGIKKVLITCTEGNIASEKTIIKNGGVYENRIEAEGRVMKRYWISL